MSNEHTSETKYLLKKEVIHHKQCRMCGGTGRNGNGTKCNDCTNGVSEYRHQTTIELVDALIELGLVKQ